MHWLLPARRSLSAHAREAIHEWRMEPRADLRSALPEARFVVIDTETSGIDPDIARVLSIGACLVEHEGLPLDAALELFIHQDTPSDDHNILIHGIGQMQQREGIAPEDAWLRFVAFAGRTVPVGYHALFDATVVRRHLRSLFGIKHRADWLDVGVILSGLFPDLEAGNWELDHWLSHAGIDNFARHSALADAFATAELFLFALAGARRRGIADVRGLFALQQRELLRLTQGMPVA